MPCEKAKNMATYNKMVPNLSAEQIVLCGRRRSVVEKILETFIWELLSSEGIPVHNVRLPCSDWSWIDLGLRQNILGMDDLSGLISRLLRHYEDAVVYHITDLFQCSYTTLRLPEEDAYLIIGPLLFEEIDDDRIDALLKKLKLPDRIRQPLRNHYSTVKFVPYQGSYENLVNLAASHLFGKGQYQVRYNDAGALDEWCRFYSGYLNIPERPFENIQVIEKRYQLENALLLAITAGNEAQALAHLSGLQAVWLPRRMPSELRDQKDYAITLNSIMRKAAEQAGVHPIHIDSCSNQNVQRIEQMTRTNQLISMAREMVHGYCRLVQTYKQGNHSRLVQKTITLVAANLTADLSLKSLAEQMNINASYLSSLFRKEMGMPLTEYVNRSRIIHAQRLLLTTNLPTKSIALQCGISDAGYFSRLFKRLTGMTPKAYRGQGSMDDFQEMANSAFQDTLALNHQESSID